MARSPSRRASKFALSPEEREERMNEASTRMEEAVKSLMTGDNFRAALRASALFPEYSFGNTIMIWSQKPDASMICGFESWKKLDRHVKKGEKGLKIFVPMLVRDRVDGAGATTGGEGVSTNSGTGGDVETSASSGTALAGQGGKRLAFRLGSVFDVSQTEGMPVPEVPRPKILEGDSPLIRAAIVGLCDFNAARGVPVSFTELNRMPEGVNGYWSPGERCIEVRQSLPPLQRLKTLTHETAHGSLHLTMSNSDAERRTRELEAESTAYLVLDSLGIDGAEEYSFPYLAYYSKTPESILGVAERARKEAGTIIDAAYQAINQQLGTEFIRGVPLDALESRAEEIRASKSALAEGKTRSRGRPARVSDTGSEADVVDASAPKKHAGLFIALEGVDGIGKTTALPIVAERLRRATGRTVVCVREPGGTQTGDEIRAALKAGIGASDPHQQLAMFCTARKALIDQVVRPAIEAGSVVIADRHSLSTYVYQGGDGVTERQIAEANAAAVGNTRPDATVVLWATRDILTGRRATRNAVSDNFDEVTEDGTVRALERQARYVALANRTPGAVTVAVQGTPEATAAAVVDRLAHVIAGLNGETTHEMVSTTGTTGEEEEEEVEETAGVTV
ncbi:MAG: dTMP kinase [Gemmatimonadaceae bacterium]